MIQKIASNEYLKRLDNMDGGEREEYLKRVGEWLKKQAPALMRKMDDPSSVFQNAVQCSIGWNDAVCLAWNDGVRLLTAMAGKADTWLPDMLYTKSAKRAIRQMVTVLQPVGKPTGTVARQQTKQVAKEEPAVDTRKGTQAVATVGRDTIAGQQTKPAGETAGTVAATPVRPKHIDQYVHLLPKKTQEKASTVQGLLRELDMAREKMRLLMDDPSSSPSSRASWATTAGNIDKKVKAIYKELDAEWEKLVASGRVTVDDFGNAHVIESEELRMKNEEFASATEGAETGTDAAQKALEAEAKQQIKSLRSWLRDTRGPKEDGEKKDAYVVRWKEKYQEMVRLGGKDTVTEAVLNAAKLYGINLAELEVKSEE